MLILFRYEIFFTINAIRAAPALMRGQPSPYLPSVDLVLPHVLYAGVVGLGLVALIIFFVILVSRAALPVHSGGENLAAAQHFFSFLLGSPVWLARINEGHVTGDPLLSEDEMLHKTKGLGVVWVDPNSAVVIEKTHSGWVRGAGHKAMSRVGRPGLVFVGPHERLRGAVGLRKNFRINLNVLSKTGDGLEVKCHIFAIFSLSQPASIYQVAYVGAQEPSSLQVIQIDPNTRQIVGITNDLDDIDKYEIHQFAQIFQGNFSPLGRLEFSPRGSDQPPYAIEDQRVFAALYSKARSVDAGEHDSWSDLPAQVATEIFRNMIGTVRYDDMFSMEQDSEYALQTQFKPAFARRVRTLGIASFQYIQRQDGQLPAIGQKVDNRSFYIAAPRDLRSSKAMRDRGIKVIHAGFSELNPTDPAVKNQRLDNWRAQWQRVADMERARAELEVERTRFQARIEKQREMTTYLSQLIQNTSYSEEALTLQIFQTLEDMATDPTISPFLPSETMRILHSLRMEVLPGDNGTPSPPQLSSGSTEKGGPA